MNWWLDMSSARVAHVTQIPMAIESWVGALLKIGISDSLWEGGQLVVVSPSAADRELLSAIVARDDYGSYPAWVWFRLIKYAASIGFYIILVCGAVLILPRSQRSLRSTRAENYPNPTG
jgi:hypothetical protein